MATYPITRIDPITPGREYSPAVWGNALEQYGSDPSIGTLYQNDFSAPINVPTVSTYNGEGWFVSPAGAGATAASLASIADADGVARGSATNAAAHGAACAQAAISATVGENIALPTHSVVAKRKSSVVFEARVLLNTATNDTMLVGLAVPNAAATTLVTALSVLQTTADYIGFYRLSGGNLQFVSRNASGTSVALDLLTTAALAAAPYNNAYVKLGFRVNEDGTVAVFINGARIRATTAGVAIDVPSTALPTQLVTRTILISRGASGPTPTTLDADFIAAYAKN